MSKRPKTNVRDALKSFGLMAIEHDDISSYRLPKLKKGLPFTPKSKKKK